MSVLSMKKALLCLLLAAPAAFAQETNLDLDPAQTQVQFTLSDVLHTVHGSFRLKRGTMRYDFATGKASGEIVIDARSGDSGSGARDKRMHKNVLESDRFPEIAFVPDWIEGSLARAKVHGTFRIHGQDHEMTMQMTGSTNGNQVEVRGQFVVPYVRWGMKDPSTLILKVGNTVTIDVDASGQAQ
jgi:polyisoprenoid-binding protein YceI